MTLEALNTQYPFTTAQNDALQKAGLSENIDLFKVVAHFVKHGDLTTVKAFLDAGFDVNAAETGDFGSSLLHNAIRYGQMEVFTELINQGANIDFVDAVGWTPLMEAIIDSKPEFGRILVEKGADQSIANKRGANAKMLAMKFGQDAFLTFLD
jgi:ankyrin repeat protein